MITNYGISGSTAKTYVWIVRRNNGAETGDVPCRVYDCNHVGPLPSGEDLRTHHALQPMWQGFLVTLPPAARATANRAAAQAPEAIEVEDLEAETPSALGGPIPDQQQHTKAAKAKAKAAKKEAKAAAKAVKKEAKAEGDPNDTLEHHRRPVATCHCLSCMALRSEWRALAPPTE